MYTNFFNLKEKPFAITPDPRYLFMSERHAEALAHLMYGVNEAGGFVQLTGDIGTGKTTLVRTMLEKMPQHAEVAVILNPRVTPLELLLSICQELKVATDNLHQAGGKALIDALNQKLLDAHSKGRRVIVIIDEAQNLSGETLEQVRLLTNLETASTKLLQIILIGQPELREVLAHSSLKQLAQRITGRYHLSPLSRDESLAYVRHRMKVAGATSEIFTSAALREIHRLTGGVPRLINVVCDRALLGAYAEYLPAVDAGIARRAAAEVFGKSVSPRWVVWTGAGVGAIAVATLAVGLVILFSNDSPAIDLAPQIAAAAPPVETRATVAAVPAIADVGELLNASAHTSAQSTHGAFQTLLGLWGAKLEPGARRPCEQATAQGLECIYQKGSWGQLRILNRPVILSLVDDRGALHQAVLTGLKDQSAQMQFDGAAREVSLSSLSRYWLGDYLLVWRPQVSGARPLSVGMRGTEVNWLRRSLAIIQNAPAAESDNDYFDEALAQQVQEFQRANRLTVDGIAGVQTQIALDSLVDTSTAPRLIPTVAKRPS